MTLPELVIFDCDGILVDTENMANERLAVWLTEAGYPADFDYCRKRFRPFDGLGTQRDP